MRAVSGTDEATAASGTGGVVVPRQPDGSSRESADRTSARGSRPAPTRVPELRSLGLHQLRGYRQQLCDEEHRVSYWRRLVQARLDVLRSAADDRGAVARLGALLAPAPVRHRRTALLATSPLVDTPPLPDLPALWACEPRDEASVAALARRLGEAEAQLSTYRSALHARLDLVTRELIARYHEDPTSCLVALPLPSPR